MHYNIPTKGVCPLRVEFDLEGDKVTNIQFYGGCNGNLKAIAALVDGMTVDELDSRLGDNKCGSKSTSCAAQLVLAVKRARQEQK
jgi:uncharacterized protein (TIGR03905 family)